MDLEARIIAASEECDLIRASGGPDDALLADAPTLDPYEFEQISAFRIFRGIVRGHPQLHDGDQISTTLVIAVDPHLRWARTLTGWYRLRHPK
ncbi:hypothetical protein KQX63_06905 [Rhodopseudomonas palustris]|uniref:DUF6634 family protein n=1 Tax=Rhodopseudomonas palustris TaxID=1076 RepID=UPI0021F27496|nr:DUF6634 family protein [Rhodopseudomonas palustris]UYO45737.1 hypothetical protein KQX63_06905 [Rhodopseudomonas palustris]